MPIHPRAVPRTPITLLGDLTLLALTGRGFSNTGTATFAHSTESVSESRS